MHSLITRGGLNAELTDAETDEFLRECLGALSPSPAKALLVPPDFTRFHSGAGEVCSRLYSILAENRCSASLLPALGTHRPMTGGEMNKMFPAVPHGRILVHDWQNGLSRMGEIPGSRIHELSGGKVDYPVNIEIDHILTDEHDVIFSIGQVVPHEVAGMAGGNKNILVGTAGSDTINKSHFLGAVCDMEKIMGRADTPVRALFNEAEDRFLADLPIVYILIVRGPNESGELVTRGLFCGTGREAYNQAAELSRKANIMNVPPLKKVVVYLDPSEFKSTWLGNKAVYRTRMAIADDGELLVIAPGLVEFGEAESFDRLIRRHGYRGTPAILRAVKEDKELGCCLGAAAHLIHGSSEGRFSITYAPGGLKRNEIEDVGFLYADLQKTVERYDPARLKDGFNTMPDGEEIYFISNPAIGLWQSEIAEKTLR